MKQIITSNDTSINIKYIDDEESHYQLNIPNNDINKDLIENTIFKFEKSGTQTIIMHVDNNVFHLSKMECKYSEFIEMKKQLENTEKEIILLKQELSKNEKELVNFKNDLLQQMKNEMVQLKNELSDTNKLFVKEIEKVNDKSLEVSKDMEQFNKDINLPFVFKYGKTNYDITHYGNKQIVIYNNPHDVGFLTSLKELKITFIFINDNYTFRLNTIYESMIIPPGKILISINKNNSKAGEYCIEGKYVRKCHMKGIYIYNKGIHYNISIGDCFMLINEKNIDNILALLKENIHFQDFAIKQIESACLEEL